LQLPISFFPLLLCKLVQFFLFLIIIAFLLLALLSSSFILFAFSIFLVPPFVVSEPFAFIAKVGAFFPGSINLHFHI